MEPSRPPFYDFFGIERLFGMKWYVIAFIGIILIFLAGCTHTVSYDPPLVEYTKLQQKQAANELREARPKYPMISRFVDDYGKLRAGIRKARKIGD